MVKKKLFWTAAAALVLGSFFILAAGSSALANNGPHEGTFVTTSNACAGCHRTHTAQTSKLLKVNGQYDLCVSCHDGSGANTKVTTGVYLGTANGTLNAGLRGGGFEQALMNVSLNSSFGSSWFAPVTSRHSVNGTLLTTWGSSNGTYGENVTLICINCHNPHGNGQYRILRPKPSALSGYASLNAVGVSGGATEVYTVAYTSNYTRDLTTYGGNVSSGIGNWCAQCHTKYLASTNSSSTNSTYTGFFYRHMTNGLDGECFRCHVAHGTSANMTGWSGNTSGPTWPDGNATKTWQTTYGESQYSRLLTVNDRGVCMQCHSVAVLTGY